MHSALLLDCDFGVIALLQVCQLLPRRVIIAGVGGRPIRVKFSDLTICHYLFFRFSTSSKRAGLCGFSWIFY